MPTLFEKLWDAHTVAATPGGATIIAIDRVFLHERTGAVALKSLAAAGRAVAYPQQAFATMDHIIDTWPGRGDATAMPGGTAFISETREAAHARRESRCSISDRRNRA